MKKLSLAGHIAQTTLSTLSPQDRYRENGSGNMFSFVSIMTPQKGDIPLWCLTILILGSIPYMGSWMPPILAFLGLSH
jgi:hypothetical protein